MFKIIFSLFFVLFFVACSNLELDKIICETKADCPSDAECDGNKCKLKTDRCTDSKERCDPELTGSIQVCNNGSWEDKIIDNCKWNEECNDNGNVIECKAISCNSNGETQCYDTSYSGLCKNNKWTLRKCAENETCNDETGTCKATETPICTDTDVSNCPSQDYKCLVDEGDQTKNKCVECITNTDCKKISSAGITLICNEEHTCVEIECTNDFDCGPHSKCITDSDPLNNTCKCEFGYEKDGNVCKPNNSCSKGAKRCSEDYTKIKTCGSNNQWDSESPCDLERDELCISGMDATDAQCANACEGIHCTASNTDTTSHGVCHVSTTGGANGKETMPECFCNSSYRNKGNKCLFIPRDSPCKDDGTPPCGEIGVGTCRDISDTGLGTYMCICKAGYVRKNENINSKCVKE